MSATTSLSTMQPSQIVDGVVFDRTRGAANGFVSNIWVPESARIDTGGISQGSFLIDDPRFAFRLGLEGNRAGLAKGAPRPEVLDPVTSEVSWATRRRAAKKQYVGTDIPDYYRQGTAWNSADARALAAQRATDAETKAARHIGLSMLRQREFDLATTVCGTDLAGTSAGVPVLDLSNMSANYAGGGEDNWNAESFPMYDFIDDVLNYLEDETGMVGWDVLIPRATARRMAKNEQIQGLKIVRSGTVAEGYASSGFERDSRLMQSAVVDRVQGMDRIRRALIAGARFDAAASSASESIQFIWPECLHFCYFGEATPLMGTGSRIEVEAAGMVEITSHRQGLFRYDDPEKQFMGWAAEENSVFAPVIPSHALTIFNT